NDLVKDGKKSFDWKSWWLPSESEEAKNKEKVELFQFIGKDNIPFHTVIFPCTLLGSPHDWTKLYHMSSTEYLNYEDTKFSKSRGVGVFGTDAIETGILADAWRFYIFYNRPEKQDFQFMWKDFQEKMNSELIGNLGNLVNRTLLFVNKYYNGNIPDAPVDEELWAEVRQREQKVTEMLEWSELKDAFHEIFAISDICNKKFQMAEPWKTRTTEPEKAESLIHNLCYVIKDLMIMMNPYMPQYTQKVMSYFGKSIQESKVGVETKSGLNWSSLGEVNGLSNVGATEVYFTPMDKKTMEAFKEKFSGNQNDRNVKNDSSKDKKKSEKKNEEISVLAMNEQPAFFSKNIRLKVAKIVSIERNPDSDKLYVEHMDDGSGIDRVIQSGLVPYLKEDELLGKNVIIVDNLKERKMRGIASKGMLLAADYQKDGKDAVEVLTAPWAEPGTEVILEGDTENLDKPAEIEASEFFKIEINTVNKNVEIGGKKLLAKNKIISTEFTVNGGIH
ncbi:MAG: class I tRNA ligase family protein, partial [Treponema sp.]|nr:class I tRNA ligase family protein [Treponema sp.]